MVGGTACGNHCVRAAIFSAVLTGPNGDTWGAGGGGEAIGATLVSSVPLPANPSQTQNVLANESKGHHAIPTQRSKRKTPDAIEIQGKNAKIKPKKKQETVSKEKPQAAPEPEDNQVAFGEGGPVSGPYGSFNAGNAKGGFGVTGGGGDFGTKYAWYVHVIQQKVSENWLKYEVDPRITSAQRVYISFDVASDGHPANVQVEQSSGVPSLDISAVRALQRIDTFGPLPPIIRAARLQWSTGSITRSRPCTPGGNQPGT